MRIARGTHRIRAAAFVVCLSLALSGLTAVAAEEPGNQTVRAGIFYFEGYHMKDGEGNLAGYGIEFLDLVSEYSHLNFTYAGYDKSWKEMLDMLEQGEIDVLTSARKIPEREEKFAFSQPIGKNSTVLSVQVSDRRFASGDYASWDGMRVGLVTGSSQNQVLDEFARERQFSYEAVEYDDAQGLAAALQEGRIDAILSSNLRKTVDERILETLETKDFYAIVRKGDQQLLAEINYAIAQMDMQEGDWPNNLFHKYYGGEYSTRLAFTEREQAYIEAVRSGKKAITVTAVSDRMPYSYAENGTLKGILPAYFDQLMEMAGLPYEIVVPQDREEYYKIAGTNGVDVVMDRRRFEKTADPGLYHGFYTDSYITTGIAKVTRKDFSGEVKTVATAEAWSGIAPAMGQFGDAKVVNYSNC